MNCDLFSCTQPGPEPKRITRPTTKSAKTAIVKGSSVTTMSPTTAIVGACRRRADGSPLTILE